MVSLLGEGNIIKKNRISTCVHRVVQNKPMLFRGNQCYLSSIDNCTVMKILYGG